MFQYDFIKTAFLIGIIISIICSTIGVFLVLKRFSMVGDTLSHISLSGVAIGMVTGIYPIYSAVILSVVASLGIEKLRKKYEHYAELVLSIFLAGGIGLSSILISYFDGKVNGIMGYLFGSITLVNKKDLYLTLILALFILGSMLFISKGLFYTIFDEEGAKIAGVNVGRLNSFFSVIVALSVTISMRIVGILLVSSLMIIPVAISIQIAKSFKQTLIYSNIFGVISVILGLILSFYLDIAPGGTIVMVSLLILIVVLVFMKIFKRH